MIQVRDNIQEAFSAAFVPKAIQNMASILSKRTGLEMVPSDIPISYTNAYGTFDGYLVSAGDMYLRVNFIVGKSNKIYSVDVYYSPKPYPDYTIDMGGYNIVQVLDTIEDVLNQDFSNIMLEAQRGRKSFAPEVFNKWVKQDKKEVEGVLQNMRISQAYEEFKDWAMNAQEPEISSASFVKLAKEYLASKNLVNKYARTGTVKKGTSEKPANVDKEADKEFKAAMKISYQEKFDMLKEYVRMITATDVINSLYVYGPPGTGKSFTVRETLKELNVSPQMFSGGVKGTAELVKILYLYRDNEIIVFDDFDSVMKNKEQKNILKTALQDESERIITFVDKTKRTKKDTVPSQFSFTSGVIFISNERRVDPAIKSRSLVVEISLTNKEILQKIESALGTFLPNTPMEMKKEVLEFLTKISGDVKRIDFRQFKFAVANRIAKPKDWKKWVVSMLSS